MSAIDQIVEIDAAMEAFGLRAGVTLTGRPCSLRWIAQQLHAAGLRLARCVCLQDERAEDCPLHGRTHDGWVEEAQRLSRQNNDMFERLAAIRDVAALKS